MIKGLISLVGKMESGDMSCLTVSKYYKLVVVVLLWTYRVHTKFIANGICVVCGVCVGT